MPTQDKKQSTPKTTTLPLEGKTLKILHKINPRISKDVRTTESLR